MQALIYSNGSQECERAKMLLEAVHEDTKEFLLDTDFTDCLLYTSPSPRDSRKSRMPSSA